MRLDTDRSDERGRDGLEGQGTADPEIIDGELAAIGGEMEGAAASLHSVRGSAEVCLVLCRADARRFARSQAGCQLAADAVRETVAIANRVDADCRAALFELSDRGAASDLRPPGGRSDVGEYPRMPGVVMILLRPGGPLVAGGAYLLYDQIEVNAPGT